MPSETQAGGVLDRPRAPGEIVPDHLRALRRLGPVAVAVQRHRVPAPGDLGRQRGPAFDLFADQEERGLDVRRRQYLEHGRRPLRMRSVIERQRHAERRRGAGDVWGEELTNHAGDDDGAAGAALVSAREGPWLSPLPQRCGPRATPPGSPGQWPMIYLYCG